VPWVPLSLTWDVQQLHIKHQGAVGRHRGPAGTHTYGSARQEGVAHIAVDTTCITHVCFHGQAGEVLAASGTG
jgi:hypothetical protein